MRKVQKGIVSFFGVLIVVMGLYWAKCQLGIDVIAHFAWEDRFPILNVLQRHETILQPKVGENFLLSNFDELFPYRVWTGIWSRDEGMVRVEIVPQGLDNSRCLLITSHSEKDWSFGFQHLAMTAPGDEFILEGTARRTKESVAQLGVELSDENKDVVQWLYALEEVRSENWIKVQKRFVIPKGARYFRLRLTGIGRGESYYDDIRLRRVK